MGVGKRECSQPCVFRTRGQEDVDRKGSLGQVDVAPDGEGPSCHTGQGRQELKQGVSIVVADEEEWL